MVCVMESMEVARARFARLGLQRTAELSSIHPDRLKMALQQLPL